MKKIKSIELIKKGKDIFYSNEWISFYDYLFKVTFYDNSFIFDNNLFFDYTQQEKEGEFICYVYYREQPEIRTFFKYYVTNKKRIEKKFILSDINSLNNSIATLKLKIKINKNENIKIQTFLLSQSNNNLAFIKIFKKDMLLNWKILDQKNNWYTYNFKINSTDIYLIEICFKNFIIQKNELNSLYLQLIEINNKKISFENYECKNFIELK